MTFNCFRSWLKKFFQRLFLNGLLNQTFGGEYSKSISDEILSLVQPTGSELWRKNLRFESRGLKQTSLFESDYLTGWSWKRFEYFSYCSMHCFYHFNNSIVWSLRYFKVQLLASWQLVTTWGTLVPTLSSTGFQQGHHQWRQRSRSWL